MVQYLEDLSIDGNLSVYTGDGLAFVHLIAVHRANTLNPQMVYGLKAAVTHLQSTQGPDAPRAIVIAAQGPAFCHGMDFTALLGEDGSTGNDDYEAAVTAYQDLLKGLSQGPKPTVGLITGSVKAGGVGIACSCDMVYATDDATWELSEVFFGLIPANVLPFLIDRIGVKKAKQLTLSARAIDAQEALTIGLADGVYPRQAREGQASFETVVRGHLKTLLRAEPAALEAARELIDQTGRLSLDQQLEASGPALLSLMNRPETRRSIADFREGIMPPWFGRLKKSTNILPPENPTRGEA